MLYYDRIDLSEGINLTKVNNRKECIVNYYCYFNYKFNFQNSVCNSCLGLTMLCFSLSNIAIITFKKLFITALLMTLANLVHFVC